MNWTITMHSPESKDYDGYINEEKTEVFEIPFSYRQEVYYAHKKRKKWILEKCMVMEVWATNMVGIKLNNGEYISEHYFNRLFTNKDEAIDFCLRQNEKVKVKIKNPYNL